MPFESGMTPGADQLRPRHSPVTGADGAADDGAGLDGAAVWRDGSNDPDGVGPDGATVELALDPGAVPKPRNPSETAMITAINATAATASSEATHRETRRDRAGPRFAEPLTGPRRGTVS